mmetsp:Transcript_71998/g.211369  ORF Transcript_71998/g.211369 Transcript_71998/m.211369 type:complete len:1246 (+) Transcript_71998:73-3810(+)
MFDALDTNQDGIITREEFNAVMAGGVASPPPPFNQRPAPPFAFRRDDAPGMPVGPMMTSYPSISPVNAAPIVVTGAPQVSRVVSLVPPRARSPDDEDKSRSPERRRRNKGDSDDKDERKASEKIASLRSDMEREMQEMERELRQDMERKLAAIKKSLDRDRAAHHSKHEEHGLYLRDSLGDHSAKVDRLHNTISQTNQVMNQHAMNHGALSQRLEKMEKVMQATAANADSLGARMNQVDEEIQNVIKRALMQHDKELMRVEMLVGGEALAREAHHSVINEQIKKQHDMLHKTVEGHISGIKDHVDGHVSGMREHVDGMHKNIKGHLEDSIQGHISGIKDHVEGHISGIRDHVEGHVAGMKDHIEGHVTGMKDHIGGAMNDLEGHKAGMPDHHAGFNERLEYLEKALGDSADKHARELEATKKKLEQLQGRVSDGPHMPTLDERLNQIEDSLRQVHGRVNTNSIQPPYMSDRSASMNDGLARDLRDRVEQLENYLNSQGDKHGRDLDTLKGSHKAIHQNHVTLEERMNYLEQLLGDSVDRHSKIDQLHARIGGIEGHATAMQQLKKAHSILAADKAALEGSHATLKERVEFLEGTLGGADDKRSRAMEAANTRIEQIRGRLSVFEKKIDSLEDRKVSTRRASRTMDEESGSALKERLDYVEDLHGKGIDNAHLKLDDVLARLTAFEKHSALMDQWQRSNAAFTPAEKAQLGALGYDLESLKETQGRHARDLEQIKQANVHHSTMNQRMDYVEKVLGDSADKHAKVLADAHAKLNDMHGRVTLVEGHGASLQELQKQHGNLRKEKAALEAGHASMEERMTYLESTIGDSANRHAKEIEQLKVSATRLAPQHANVEERLLFLEQNFGDSADRHKEVTQSHAKLEKTHASLKERVAFLEDKLGDHAEWHEKEINGLKNAHTRLAMAPPSGGPSSPSGRDFSTQVVGDQGVMALAHAHGKHAEEIASLKAAHLTHAEEIAVLHNKASRHAEDVSAAHAKAVDAQGKLEHMHDRVSLCEGHGKALEDLKRGHHTLANKKEQLAADHMALRDLVNSHADHHDKHAEEARELKMGQVKLKQHQDKVANHLEQEKEAHGTHRATVEERLGYLEGLIGDSADKHTKEILDLKAANMQHGKDLKARDGHHATMEERVGYVEQVLGFAAEVASSQGGSMRSSSLAYGVVPVKERVEFLETLVGGKAGSFMGDNVGQPIAKRVDAVERALGEIVSSKDAVNQIEGRISAVKAAWNTGW